VSHLIDTVGAYVAVPAALGLLLLLPLYLSQHRDLTRLRWLMETRPDFPRKDLLASEAVLDRAEAELESIVGATPTVVRPPQTTGGAMTPLPPARRVTAERPALERITMERAALEPHPRWRRFASSLTRPRTLVVIALVAVALGAAALIGSHELLHNDTTAGGTHRAGAPASSGAVTVAVLNGTSKPGLAGPVSATLRENGFKEGAISTTRKPYQQTVVMYAGGEKKEAEKVARVLGVTPVQRIDQTTRAIAGAADVVVIAGADRTRR
jgi:hypothetical protein